MSEIGNYSSRGLVGNYHQVGGLYVPVDNSNRVQVCYPLKDLLGEEETSFHIGAGGGQMTEGICRQRFINQVGFVNPAVRWRFTTVSTSHYVINQAKNVGLSVSISITDSTSHMAKNLHEICNFVSHAAYLSRGIYV